MAKEVVRKINGSRVLPQSLPKKKPTKRKRLKGDRTQRFDCKVNAELFKMANAMRLRSWPDLVEAMFKKVINESAEPSYFRETNK